MLYAAANIIADIGGSGKYINLASADPDAVERNSQTLKDCFYIILF